MTKIGFVEDLLEGLIIAEKGFLGSVVSSVGWSRSLLPTLLDVSWTACLAGELE